MVQKQADGNPYSSKIWLKSYDDHVKPEIELEVYTLADMLRRTIEKYPDSLCYDFQGNCATFQEAGKFINSFSNFLVENGIKKGDRVAISLPNLPQFIIALFGTFCAGCAASGINFLLSPKEITYQLKDCGAVAIVTLDSFYEEKVREALQGDTDVKVVLTTNSADTLDIDEAMKEQLIKIGRLPFGKVEPIEGINYFTYKEIIEKYPSDKPPDVQIEPDDLLLLQYTGGTTGPSKGAMLTHRNLVSMLQMIFHWFEPGANPGSDIYISGFPFFHVAGLEFCLQSFYNAAAQILVPDPRDVAYISNKMLEYQGRIKLMYNVPTLYMMLLKNRKFKKKIDFSSMIGCISGAAPFPTESIKEFEAVIGKEKVLEGYGMTEASPAVTMAPLFGTKKIGYVGVPIPNTEVKLVDITDRNKEVPLGEPGEIAIRGPQIFQGYWNKPKETENALRDGYFYSGDVGIMDSDGYIKLVDRTKDMIIVSGFKVFSVEVDDKMNKHPAIELCACIGLPDPDRPGSEIVKLYVQLKEGYESSDDMKADILKFSQENLAKYKIPKMIEIVNELPLTTIGKVDKKALRK
jgi:acyl-CoA synthetase (AMP-forming)/AMP-acid ligase II